jgi:putative ABC transport system permease protein
MTIPIQYCLRGLWRRRTTTLATALGIALVVFVLATSQMLAEGLRSTLLSSGKEDKALVLQADAYAEGGSRLSPSVLTLATGLPHVRADAEGRPLATGEYVTHVNLGTVKDAARYASVQVRGITERSFALRPEVAVVSGRRPTPGTNEAMVGAGLVGQFRGLQLGDGFELQKNRRLQIVGEFSASNSAYESEVWADLDTVRSSLGFSSHLSSVTVQLTTHRAFDGFAQALQAEKRLGVKVERERAYYTRVSNNLARVITTVGGLVAFIFSFGAMLGATITFYGSVDQRRRELAVLRAVGFARGQVLLAVLLESLAVAALGGAAGVVLALLTQLVHFSTINWATGQELVFRFLPSSAILAGALSAGVVVGVIGGLLPAIAAARIAPSVALRR